jgi:hypothetical protein
MSKITVEIKTDNAAFNGYGYGTEVARILREAAERVDCADNIYALDHVSERPLLDVNGNRVGTVTVTA